MRKRLCLFAGLALFFGFLSSLEYGSKERNYSAREGQRDRDLRKSVFLFYDSDGNRFLSKEEQESLYEAAGAKNFKVNEEGISRLDFLGGGGLSYGELVEAERVAFEDLMGRRED